jgi:hypothetical protein
MAKIIIHTRNGRRFPGSSVNTSLSKTASLIDSDRRAGRAFTRCGQAMIRIADIVAITRRPTVTSWLRRLM